MAQKAKAILIRCTPEDYDAIHRAAKLERRTVSGFILNAAMSRIETRTKLLRELDEARQKKQT
jgi:uncharacterized protein (DUF1778 family)